jgi:hypothetical protein
VVGVEPNAGALEYRRRRRAGTSTERNYPRGQLGKGERLGQVVVSAQGQPLHSVIDIRGGGEHKDPRSGLTLHQSAAHVVPVNDRQVTVEDHDVIVVDAEALQRGPAVVDHIHCLCVAAQPLGHRIGQQRLVLDYQDSHSSIVTDGDISSAFPISKTAAKHRVGFTPGTAGDRSAASRRRRCERR